jgi:hypothetical protein
VQTIFFFCKKGGSFYHAKFFLLFKVEEDSYNYSLPEKKPRWGDNTLMQATRQSITSSLDQPGPSHDSVNSAQNSMRESVIRYAPRSLCNELTATSMVSAIYQIAKEGSFKEGSVALRDSVKEYLLDEYFFSFFF